MTIFDKKKTENFDGSSIDEDAELWISWKPNDCNEMVFGACEECKTFQVQQNNGKDILKVGRKRNLMLIRKF